MADGFELLKIENGLKLTEVFLNESIEKFKNDIIKNYDDVEFMNFEFEINNHAFVMMLWFTYSEHTMN